MPGFEHLFRILCHQLPSRSPQWEGIIFPLCWRCAGMYLGMFSCYVSLVIGSFRRRRPLLFPHAALLIVLALPLAVDGLGNFLSLWSSPGWIRAVTGLGAGVALPLWLQMLMHTSDVSVPPSGLVAPYPSTFLSTVLWPIAIGSAGIWLLVHPFSTLLFRILAIAAATGTVLFFAQFSRAWFCSVRPGRPVASTKQFAHEP